MKLPRRAKIGRPLKDRRKHVRIIATWEEEDNGRDIRYHFRGITKMVLHKAFTFLIGNGNGIARSFRIWEQHDVIRRNAHGFWRVTVAITEPNHHFCSLESQRLLIESTVRRLHPCTLHWTDLDRFLNT